MRLQMLSQRYKTRELDKIKTNKYTKGLPVSGLYYYRLMFVFTEEKYHKNHPCNLRLTI